MKKIFSALGIPVISAAVLALTACTSYPLSVYLVHPVGEAVAQCLEESLLQDSALDEAALAEAGVQIVDEAQLQERLGGAADGILGEHLIYLYASMPTPYRDKEHPVVYTIPRTGSTIEHASVVIDDRGDIHVMEEGEAVSNTAVRYTVSIHEVNIYHFLSEGDGYAPLTQTNFIVAYVYKTYWRDAWDATTGVYSPESAREEYTLTQFGSYADNAWQHTDDIQSDDIRIDEFTLTDGGSVICDISVPREK